MKKFFHLKSCSRFASSARFPHDLLTLPKNTIKFFVLNKNVTINFISFCYIQINFRDILFLWSLHADVYGASQFIQKSHPLWADPSVLTTRCESIIIHKLPVILWLKRKPLNLWIIRAIYFTHKPFPSNSVSRHTPLCHPHHLIQTLTHFYFIPQNRE